MEGKTFEITRQHIDLLRNSYTSWDNTEFGAACIDPKRPYGRGDVYDDIARILHIKPIRETEDEKSYDSMDILLMDKIHRETKTALQIFLVTGKMETGTYQETRIYDGLSWQKIAE